MEKKKRFLMFSSITLAMLSLLLVGLFAGFLSRQNTEEEIPAEGEASDYVTMTPSANLAYSYNDTTLEATITGIGDFAGTELVTPSTVKNGDKTYTVTRVDNNAFKNNTNLTLIYLSNNIKYVGNGAFNGCVNVEELYVGTGLNQVGYYSFYNLAKVKNMYWNAIECYCYQNGPGSFGSDNWIFSYLGKTAYDNGEEIILTIGKDVKNLPSFFMCPSYTGNNYVTHSPRITRINFEEGSQYTGQYYVPNSSYGGGL